MLKRENRLTTNFEFNTTRKYGRYASGTYFHLYLLKPKSYTGPTKVGIVISTRFHKNSTVRNRVKRLFREALRKDFAKMGEDYWVAIYPKISCIGKAYEEIGTDVTKTLQKVSFS